MYSGKPLKRYRFSRFYVDTIRAHIENPAVDFDGQIRRLVEQRYGVLDIEQKAQRFLLVKPPPLRIVGEYNDVLLDVQDAFVAGALFSATTGACCLGERILNELIIRTKAYFKDSSGYKKVYRKNSIVDWKLMIDILKDWSIISDGVADSYENLGRIRHQYAVHYHDMDGLEDRALEALNLVMQISEELFGLRPDVFFFVEGESYIRKDAESMPVVREFFIPECINVGFKHKVEKQDGQFHLIDNFEYENKQVDDDRFRLLREQWRRGQA